MKGIQPMNFNSIKTFVQTVISTILAILFGQNQWKTSLGCTQVATVSSLLSMIGWSYKDAANLVIKQSTVPLTQATVGQDPHLWQFFLMNLATSYIFWRVTKTLFNATLNALQKSNSKLIKKIAEEIQNSVSF